MNHFWTGGPEAYETALRHEFDIHVRVLRERLKTAGSQAETLGVFMEIKELKAQLRDKLRQIGRSLF